MTRADANGVARYSAARRIEEPKGLLEERKGISVALDTDGFFRDGKSSSR